MMCPIWLYVLALLAKPHAIVDGAVENGKVGSQMLQQPRLLLGVFSLEQLIKFLPRDLKGCGHHRHRREDGLVVGPYQKCEADVKEQQQEEGLDA